MPQRNRPAENPVAETCVRLLAVWFTVERKEVFVTDEQQELCRVMISDAVARRGVILYNVSVSRTRISIDFDLPAHLTVQDVVNAAKRAVSGEFRQSSTNSIFTRRYWCAPLACIHPDKMVSYGVDSEAIDDLGPQEHTHASFMRFMDVSSQRKDLHHVKPAIPLFDSDSEAWLPYGEMALPDWLSD